MKQIKKGISLLMAVALLLVTGISLVWSEPAAETQETPLQQEERKQEKEQILPVDIKAKAAVLMDLNSGKVLLEKNPHEKRWPASVTKIMTMLLVVEAIEDGKIALSDQVTTSTYASKKGGSQVFLKEGEVMSVDDLFKAMAVHSANDASTALAEHIAGSEEEFVRLMNQRAAELGMENTNFENCSGLDDTAENHMTTAYDIALMSKEIMQYDLVMKYTTIYMDSLRDGTTELVNTNKLVRFYEGTTGLKTGTTAKAGNCIAATAKKGETHLVAVVLGSDNSKDRFNTSKAMLNWGFANFESVKLEIDPKLVPAVQVLKGTRKEVNPILPEAEQVLIPKGQKEKIVTEVNLPLDVAAPIETHQVLGTITVKLGEEILGEYSLKSPEYVEKRNFAFAFRQLFFSIIE